MKKHYRLLVVALFAMFVAFRAHAQGAAVSGTVLDAADGSPLPGVSVLENGTTNGTITDGEGKFTIKVKQGSTLIVSFVGYAQQTVVVGDQTNLSISLAADIKQLSEVVVIGYGEVQKKDATGAVYAISSKDFNKSVITSPQDLIVGKMAGVQVTSSNGAPGSGSTIRIRGQSSLQASSDPLIVVDGFPIDNNGTSGVANGLAMINPNDIETFTVLKDASATAIYGSRASGGVILITTKKGKSGKPQVSYNGTVSLSQPVKYFDVLDGNEFRKMVTGLQESNYPGIDSAVAAKLGTANTNWQKQIYRSSISTDHNIAIAGTIKKMPFRISYGYTKQAGILKKTDYDRNSLNINLSPSFLDDHLKLELSAKGSIANTNYGNTGAVGAAVSFDPSQPVMAASGADFGGYYTWFATPGVPNQQATANPVALINQTDNTSTANRLISSLKAEYKVPFLPDLKLVASGGLDISKSSGHNNAAANAAFAYNSLGSGRLNPYNGKNHSELLDLYFNYVKTLGGSKFDVTGGYSYQHFYKQAYTITKSIENNIVLSPGYTQKGEYYLVSFFGRFNYSLKDKYRLTATFRDDGTSKFPNNRWGIFPSAAVAWTIKNENFLVNSNFVSDLKLRAGVGTTGQQEVSTGNPVGFGWYPGLATYTNGQTTAQYQFGGTYYSTLRPNPYDGLIKWESTTTYNVGLDMGFKNDKITASVEVYQRDTKDLLNRVPVPAGSNFSNYLTTNVGTMQSKGIEVTLRATPISTGKLTWNAGANFTYNDNKITKLQLVTDPNDAGVQTGGISGGVGNTVQNYNIGYPASSFYVYQQVYSNGRPVEGVYVDKTGLGGNVTGNFLNRYHYKHAAPTYMIGVNSRLTYKSVDFSFSGRFMLNNYNYNNNQSSRAFYNSIYTAASNSLNNVPRGIFDTNFNNAQYTSSYYVQDASFFKMDNVSLGYNVSSLFSSKLKARFGLTVQNAFYVTRYKGLDPEVDGGIDNNIYPRPRTFLFNVNLTF